MKKGKQKKAEMKAELDATVIVVNLNGGERLLESLEGVFRQEGVAFEVILVDNGSRDGSEEEAVKRWKERITLIKNERNNGFGPANNQGFRYGRGRYFVLLNNDAVPESGWLKELITAGDSAPEAGMVASKVVLYDEPEKLDNVGHRLGLDGINRGLGRGERDEGQYDSLFEILFPSGCAAAYRREMIQKLGGFDEDFFLYGDDTELGLRALAYGFKAIFAPGAVVRHRYSQTLGDGSPEKIYWIERNRLLILGKYFPMYLYPGAAMYSTLRYLFSAVAAMRGRGVAGRSRTKFGVLPVAKSLVKGNISGLALFPKMVKKRLAMIKDGADPAKALKKVKGPFRLSIYAASTEE
ncbi:MAG: hypothetical protein Kow0090_02280 [Myxococcota bacterium]